MIARRTHIMSSNADRPEVTAATRKNSRARKKPVMSAMRAKQDPTCMLASFPLGIEFGNSLLLEGPGR